MTGKELLLALSHVDERFVKEAESVRAFPPRVWRKCAAAACFAALLAGLLVLVPRLRNQAAPDEANAETTDIPTVSAAPSTPSATPAESAVHVNLGQIIVNEAVGVTETDSAPNTALYEQTLWDADEVLAYYGGDLTPAYIPDGLTAAEDNGTADVWTGIPGTDAENTIGVDTLSLAFWNSGKTAGLTVSVSRLGVFTGAVFDYGESTVEVSDIDGVTVTFGHTSVSGSVYMAAFEYAGIQYQITASQLPLEELVKVVSSVIFDTDEIVVDP